MVKKVNYIKFGKMEPIIDDIESINLFELDLDKGLKNLQCRLEI